MPTNRANRTFRPLPLAAAIAMALVPAASHALTYTVTSNQDNSGVDPAPGAGTGTLRQAIVDANANCIADPNPVIAFAVGASPTLVSLGSPLASTANPLPPLQCASGPFNPVIDGRTQPGFAGNSDTTGFNGAWGITLDGTQLSGTNNCGLSFPQSVATGGAMTVRGMRISGFSQFSDSAICGTNMNISGNDFGGNYNGVTVQPSGTAAIGNTAAIDRNYFHGNTLFGVTASGSNTVTIVNNFIGVAPDGNSVAGNSIGVQLSATALGIIQGNVISGNGIDGIRLGDTPGSISGNQIGVGSLGTTAPNTTGINILSNSTLLNITGNAIKHNTSFGVQVSNGISVRMIGNAIAANNAKNITLDMYGGPVPNDAQDPDGGPNLRQNFPVISSVTHAAGNTTVNFTFNSTPSQTFNLEFYSNSGTGIPAGETPLGTTTVTTDAAGNSTTTSFVLTGIRDFISMLATDGIGNTSEFSPIVQATALPAVSITPPALTFGNVPINTTSPNQATTLLSSGSGNYQISQLSTGSCYGGPICYGGAEFTCSTTCVPFTPYAPGASCTITANFHPTILGPQSTNLVVCDNAAGSPRTIVISGNGVPAPTLAVTPSAIDFGNVPVGSTSPARFVTVQNPGTSPISYTAATNGPFTILGTNCTNPIPAGGSCDYEVGFAPTAGGTASGNLVLAPSSGAASTVALLGNGITAPVLGSPAEIDISYILGRSPTVQRVTLSNNGQATLTFTSITISGANFTLANQCPASLPPGSSCDVLITFSAPDIGLYNGSLTVVTNAPGGSRVIPIRGFAQPREVPFIEISPREIGYGNVAFGKASDPETIKVKNLGGAAAAFNSIVVSPGFVILSNGCGATLAPQATCEVRVSARPLGYGSLAGRFTVRSNAENSPTAIDLFGTGCRGASFVVPRLGTSGAC